MPEQPTPGPKRLGLVLRLAGVGALAAMLGASPARCEPKLEATIGWDGQVMQGCWNPVFVTVESPDRPLEGAVRVRESDAGSRRRSQAAYLLPVNLPAASRQRHVICVYVGSRVAPLTVELLEGGRPVAAEPASGAHFSARDQLLVVIGRETGSLNVLAGVGPSPVRVVYPDADLLPDRPQGWDAVDALVLGDVPTRIPRPALEAIRDWVAMGGTLVISGGANLTRLRAPPLNDLLPVGITGSRALGGLPALSSAYGAALPEGGVVVAEGVPSAGAEVLLDQDGLPLAVSRRLGAGRVVFLAFDFEAFPVKGWAGQRAMWQDLLSDVQYATPIPGDRLSNAVTVIGETQVPSFWLIAIFLIGYPVALIPVNYWWLKRRRRLELAWLTIPLIVVFFSLAAYGVGYGMKGGRLVLNRATVVEGYAGTGWARGTLVAGIFSPKKGRYRVSANGAPIAVLAADPSGEAAARTVATQRDDEITLTADIDMWAMGVFRTDVPLDLGGGIEARVEYANGIVQGEVTNHTPYDLSDCFLLLGQREQPLGALPSGKTVAIRFASKPDVASLPYQPQDSRRGHGHGPYGPRGPGAQDHRDRLKQGLREALDLTPMALGRRQPSDLLLVGWSEDTLSPLKLDRRFDRECNLNCFAIRLPYRWVPVGGRVVVPPGAAGGVCRASTATYLQYDEMPPGIRLAGGEAVYAFRTPDSIRGLRLDSVTVNYTIEGAGKAEVSAYDWSRDTWTTVGSASAPTGAPAFQLEASKTLPASRYARRGTVQVKVSQGTGGGGELRIRALAVGFSGR